MTAIMKLSRGQSNLSDLQMCSVVLDISGEKIQNYIYCQEQVTGGIKDIQEKVGLDVETNSEWCNDAQHKNQSQHDNIPRCSQGTHGMNRLSRIVFLTG